MRTRLKFYKPACRKHDVAEARARAAPYRQRTVEHDRKRFRFGPFVIDLLRGTLHRDGVPIPLPAKVFDIIAFLVEQDGKVVTREQLEHAVWGGASVADANIGQHVHLARVALGDRTKPYVYIRTVQARGYRFGVPVQPAIPGNELDAGQDVSRFTAEQLVHVALSFQRIGTPAALESCVASLQRALLLQALAPEISARLAWAYILKALYGYERPSECFALARTHVQSARHGDPAGVHAALAACALALYADRNPEPAACIAAATPSASVLRTHGLVAAERHREACAYARESAQRFPGSVTVNHTVALAHYYAGDVEYTAAHLRRLLALHPAYAPAHVLAAFADIALSCYETARDRLAGILMARAPLVAAYERYRQPAIGGLAYIEGRLGNREGARALMNDLKGAAVPSASAQIFAAMGSNDVNGAVTALTQAYDRQEPWSLFITHDPIYKEWRSRMPDISPKVSA